MVSNNACIGPGELHISKEFYNNNLYWTVDSETPEQLRICTGRKDCGSVVQNFGFMYDQESSMDMCNTSYVTKADGITCFDKYPSCKYLREQFSVCEKPEVASKLGCDLTCGKCSMYICLISNKIWISYNAFANNSVWKSCMLVWQSNSCLIPSFFNITFRWSKNNWW